MSDGHDVEWRRAVDFAEVAEVLQIRTNEVVAAMNPHANEVLVLYSPEVEGDDDLFSVWLRRDADGVLHPTALPRRHVGGMAEIMEQAERLLDERKLDG